jgi:hypothetical protein
MKVSTLLNSKPAQTLKEVSFSYVIGLDILEIEKNIHLENEKLN